jgi:hypothetical protein
VQTRSDLRRELDHCLNAAYAVEVKRNGQYVNTMPLRRLDAVQETMQPPPTTSNGTQYGQQGRASTNAIYGDDAPPRRDERSMTLSTEDVRREPERTGESELGDGSDFTQREPIKKGDIDPETGEPIPF